MFVEYNNKFINFTKIKVIIEKISMGTAGKYTQYKIESKRIF